MPALPSCWWPASEGPPKIGISSKAGRLVQTLRARNSHIKRIAARHPSSVLICMNPCGIPSITCSWRSVGKRSC